MNKKFLRILFIKIFCIFAPFSFLWATILEEELKTCLTQWFEKNQDLYPNEKKEYKFDISNISEGTKDFIHEKSHEWQAFRYDIATQKFSVYCVITPSYKAQNDKSQMHDGVGSQQNIMGSQQENLNINQEYKKDDQLASPHHSQKIYISGIAYPLIYLPVLKEKVFKGQQIKASMIYYQLFKERVMHRNILQKDKQLINMIANTTLYPYKPVLRHMLKMPILIKKGALITLYLKTPYIEITARGKAMASGNKGAIIPVMNINSKKMVEGQIIDAHHVQVQNV